MEKLKKLFIRAVGLILLSTAVIKVISALGRAGILKDTDPLLNVFTNREMLIVAAGIELMIVLVLIVSENDFIKLACICWLGSCLLLYRAGLWWLGITDCPCLGNATGWLSRDRVFVSHIMLGIATLMFSGSLYLLWPHLRLLANIPKINR